VLLNESRTKTEALCILLASVNPSNGRATVLSCDVNHLSFVLHKTCHTMSWENLVAWKGKSEPPSIVPQVDDWQFWTELATQTIRKMHIKIPRKDYKAVVYGFSTVAWIMAQDYKKGGKLYEDGTAFLKKCMKDSVQRQMNMQQGFLSLTQKD